MMQKFCVTAVLFFSMDKIVTIHECYAICIIIPKEEGNGSEKMFCFCYLICRFYYV